MQLPCVAVVRALEGEYFPGPVRKLRIDLVENAGGADTDLSCYNNFNNRKSVHWRLPIIRFEL